MSEYITELAVSLNMAEEQLRKDEGFEQVPVNVNTGAGGNTIYLWYKKAGDSHITRIQVSFNEAMEVGLSQAGYIKLPQNLNFGTSGSPLYMWYSKATIEKYDMPIKKLDITLDVKKEVEKFRVGGHWEKVHCNLNMGNKGNMVYAFVKRPRMPIVSDVTVTDSYDSDAKLFSDGYTRVDVNTNQGAVGAAVFIWYRKTSGTYEGECTANVLQISTTRSDAKLLLQDSYKSVDVDLNQVTGGNKVKLWYKKDYHGPIRVMTVVPAEAAEAYEKSGLVVIKKNLNSGNTGQTMFLAMERFWYE